MRRGLCMLCLAAMALLGPAAETALAEFRIAGLTPATGYGGWLATNQYRFEWDLVPTIGAAGIWPTGFGYRFRSAAGEPVGPEFHRNEADRRFATASIPLEPGQAMVPAGRYDFEVWLESGLVDGQRDTTSVYFDDTRPAPARLNGPDGWLRAGSSARLRVEPPQGPAPPSGIDGYAVDLDHGSGTAPCGGRVLCTAADLDVHGEGDGEVTIGPLAEETNIARVVAVSGSGMSSATAPGFELRVDGTPPLVNLDSGHRDWSPGPVPVSATAVDRGSGMSAGGATGALTAIAVDGAVASVAVGESASAVVHGEGVHEVGAYARDAVGNFSEGGEASDPPPSASVRIDETPPRVAFAEDRDPAQPERIVAVVSDALAGPDPTRGSIAVRLADSRQPFEPIPTIGSGDRLTAIWDSDSYPAGAYEFRATGYDLAGNRSSTELRASGGRMTLANPVKTPTAIAFGFGGRQLVWHRCRRTDGELHCRRQLIGPFEARPDSRSVAYGRGVPVGGRLTGPGGLPLANLPVRITEVFGTGAELTERQTTVLTDGGGVYLARLAPGPSRQIEVGYGGNAVLTRSSGRQLQLGVRAAVRLRSSSTTATIGGAPVVFSGVVAHDGAAIPATGLPVELQFRLPDLPWSEFRTVQTGPGGRFRYAYGFSDDDSRGVRFQFRARLAAQPGWPFEPGVSRPIAVTGR